MKTDSKHNFIKALIKIGTLLSWFLCFFTAISLSLIRSEDQFIKKYGCVIYIFLACMFTALKIKYLKKHSNNTKFQTINAIMPLLYVPFIISWCHANFGYGNTIGILGYNRKLGVLSEMNISRMAGSWILIIVFSAVWTLIIIRTWLWLKSLKDPIRIVKAIANIFIIGLIIFAVLLVRRSISDILTQSGLSAFSIAWYEMSSFFYWSINIAVIIFLKMRRFILEYS